MASARRPSGLIDRDSEIAPTAEGSRRSSDLQIAMTDPAAIAASMSRAPGPVS
jgi:hypothetical protein